MAAAVNGAYPTEMTEDERYLFDLNGFIVVRGVLTPVSRFFPCNVQIAVSCLAFRLKTATTFSRM